MPRPKTPIARRLDSVRTTLGLSHAEFWRRLVGEREDGSYEWCRIDRDEDSTRSRPKKVPEEPRYSYESSRRYHFKRDAPPEYLARVSEVFGVRLDWLLTGEGETWKAAGETRRSALEEAIAEAYPERFNLLPSRSQDLFLHVLMKRMRSAPDAPEWVRGVAWDDPKTVPEAVLEQAGVLLHVLDYATSRDAYPKAWGAVGIANMHPDRREMAVRLFLTYVELTTADPGQGDRWEDLEGSLHDRDRKARKTDRKKLAEAEAEIDDQRPVVGDPDPEEEDS